MPTWTKPFPKSNPFKCAAYWHLRRSGLSLAIYDLIGAVTHGGQNSFYSNPQSIATFLGISYSSCYRTMRRLCKQGWLECRGKSYYYVKHDARAEKYPHECCKRDLLDWQTDTDPFVGKLYAAAGGRLRLFEGHITGFREVAGDDEFLEAFRKELAEAEERKKQGNWSGSNPKQCLWRVYGRFKERAKNLVESSTYRSNF